MLRTGGFSGITATALVSECERPSHHRTDEALSQEGCPLQHLHIASCRLTPLHNLRRHCAIEGKSTPDYDGASSTVPRRKHLQWDLLVLPVTLEAIRTVQGKAKVMSFINSSLKLSSRSHL
ncbi:hypothetical protein JOQ06_014952 [Pogonophryne albipinna]|uniref:Uncharacterized protein n=1 Tax=Pogonophryne albipinna TaxID=1090488 RepID=A0AAD6AM55_9TELE|nr:hypothetical protein JOQ06_014952 [Pogonophryne albipinna]